VTVSTADYVKTTASTKYEELKASTTTGFVSALEASKPYVCKAIEMGQPIVLPIVEKTTPIVAPYVDYVQKAIEGNKTIAPYFEAAKTTTFSVMDSAQKFYASPVAAPASIKEAPAPVAASAAPSATVSAKPVVPAVVTSSSQKSAKTPTASAPKVAESE
jgi:hypothetical protein